KDGSAGPNKRMGPRGRTPFSLSSSPIHRSEEAIHGACRPDVLGDQARTADHAVVSRLLAEGAVGALHFPGAQDGALDRAFPKGHLGQEDRGPDLLLQRVCRGWSEGYPANPKRASGPNPRLGRTHALPRDTEYVRPAAAEGFAVVLEGRLRKRAA